jgi:hypothetical protein
VSYINSNNVLAPNLLDSSWLDRIYEFSIDIKTSIDGNSTLEGWSIELVGESARHSEFEGVVRWLGARVVISKIALFNHPRHRWRSAAESDASISGI